MTTSEFKIENLEHFCILLVSTGPLKLFSGQRKKKEKRNRCARKKAFQQTIIVAGIFIGLFVIGGITSKAFFGRNKKKHCINFDVNIFGIFLCDALLRESS